MSRRGVSRYANTCGPTVAATVLGAHRIWTAERLLELTRTRGATPTGRTTALVDLVALIEAWGLTVAPWDPATGQRCPPPPPPLEERPPEVQEAVLQARRRALDAPEPLPDPGPHLTALEWAESNPRGTWLLTTRPPDRAQHVFALMDGRIHHGQGHEDEELVTIHEITPTEE